LGRNQEKVGGKAQKQNFLFFKPSKEEEACIIWDIIHMKFPKSLEQKIKRENVPRTLAN